MKPKHTPGPWTKGNGKKEILIFADNRSVCKTWGKQKEDEANATLITVAPELLESLYNLVNAASGDTIENLKIALADAKSIIQKATS